MEFRVTPKENGLRLDQVLPKILTDLTRSQAKSLIENGHVRVDSETVLKAGFVLREGQTVRVERPPARKLELEARDVGIRVLHEDEDLAVIEKPAGLSVHPSETEQGPTVVHGLLRELKSLSSVGGVERPGIVHRIDKGTSGVLVVSKNDAAHLELSRQFKAHTIDRRYLALVFGDLAQKNGAEGTIETFYGRNPTHRKKMTGKLKSGRKAVTRWRVRESRDGLTLVECRLETGRTHQIRVHLSELGFPVVGDPLYGDHAKRSRALAKEAPELSEHLSGLKHQLLHAYRLAFTHPRSGKTIEFESPLPEDFEKTLQLLHGSARSELLKRLPHVEHEFAREGAALPEPFGRAKQVHGIDVLDLQDATEAVFQSCAQTPADGLFTDRHWAVGVQTADCLPVLFVSSKKRLAAAVHAGWRGLNMGVLKTTVERFREAGVPPSDLFVAIGPAIGPCCFEISPDVSEEFEKNWGQLWKGRPKPWKKGQPQSAHRHELQAPCGPNDLWLDLKTIAQLQLESFGVPVAQIDDIGICTYCGPGRRPSYRRSTHEKTQAARQWSWIKLR